MILIAFIDTERTHVRLPTIYTSAQHHEPSDDRRYGVGLDRRADSAQRDGDGQLPSKLSMDVQRGWRNG
jgi:hypothetical protein